VVFESNTRCTKSISWVGNILNNFVGYTSNIRDLENWLSDFFDNKNRENNYAIVVGKSGNGKTYLVEKLANRFKSQLFRITPDDIQDNNDINNVIKSLNLYNPLEGSRRKIILIDDIDEFYYVYRNRLIKDLPRLSLNPVIFTSKSFKFPPEFKNYSLKVGKKKTWYVLIDPFEYNVYQFLKTLPSDYSDKQLKDIAYKSPSVRSAILSLNGPINDIIETDVTRWDNIRNIKERKFNEPLTRRNKKYIFNSIRGCNNGTLYDLSAVVDKFLDFNERIVCKHETHDGVSEGINCWFINNMKEPVTKVKWYYTYSKKKGNNKSKKVIEKKPKKKIVKKTQMDKWL